MALAARQGDGGAGGLPSVPAGEASLRAGTAAGGSGWEGRGRCGGSRPSTSPVRGVVSLLPLPPPPPPSSPPQFPLPCRAETPGGPLPPAGL